MIHIVDFWERGGTNLHLRFFHSAFRQRILYFLRKNIELLQIFHFLLQLQYDLEQEKKEKWENKMVLKRWLKQEHKRAMLVNRMAMLVNNRAMLGNKRVMLEHKACRIPTETRVILENKRVTLGKNMVMLGNKRVILQQKMVTLGDKSCKLK